MSKKTIIQLFLLLIIFIISFFALKTYFPSQTKKIVLNKIIDNKRNKILDQNSNLIKNIKYVAEDKNGNSYTILSEFGVLSENEPDLILMTNVSAFINMKDKSQMKIFSNKAKYNRSSYNTNFQDSVLMIYENNKISADKLDFLFEKKIALMTGNIIYKNLNTSLEADKIEFDLLTKNSKIFMYKDSKKVKIISLN
jgi:lipopolysaccharide assembly outer membrane protein LptD (OstA)